MAVFNDERLNAFPLISGTKQSHLLSPCYSIQLELEILASTIRKKNKLKDIYIGKEKIKLGEGDQNGKVRECGAHLPPRTHQKYIYMWKYSIEN